MTNYQRFDLHESSYSLAIMADVTPAWREIYSVTLDELVRRYTSHWAAVDWNNMFGKDPDVGNYPEFWKGRVVPAHNFREYHTPGWVSNGHQHSLYKETTGIEEDPIGANAMLFFKGWLTQIMSIHRYVSGNDKWSKKWNMSGVDDTEHEWTHAKLARHLHDQWSSKDCGLH
jgi:hypothetical protein